MDNVPMTDLPHYLIEMGAKLKEPPEALSERIGMLDDIECLLKRVAQTPPFPICHALLPIKERLIAEEFLGSSDCSVKISTLSCIHELIRILAPVQPYDDDRMKEIFNETVKAFEHLSSGSGRCFQKAKNILYIVANVRSGLLLLDLGCTPLVAQMFQTFLRDTRSDYPAKVLSDMENLMSMLIMEADELSVDFLRPLVMSIGAENQVRSPPFASLGMKVLQDCSDIVQPFLQTVIEQMRRDLDSYSFAASSLLPKENVSVAGYGSEQVGQESDVPVLGSLVKGAQQIGQASALPGSSAAPTRKRKLEDNYVLSEARREKRERRTRRVEEVSEAREELVGSRIKVWWPADQEYYEGTVSSYNHSTKKHRVVYADGDVEILTLTQERWSLVRCTSAIQEVNQEPNPPDARSSDASSSDVPVDEDRGKGKQKLKDGESSSSKRPYRRVQSCNV